MTADTKSVLIVEDELLMVDALKKRLENEGLNVYSAKDGSEGLNIALEKHPDLILLDIVLPVMDGMTVLERLREDSWGKDVPIIVLSNLNRASTVAKSKKKRVNAYLVKTDWKLSEVVQKVKHELGIV